MKNIYNGFTFVKALSLNNPNGTKKIEDNLENNFEEKPFSHAVVELRPIYKTYIGDFGFDWYRKKDNGHLVGQNYQSCILSGYKNGNSDLTKEEAINRFLDMYEEYPINLVSRKNKKEREEKNYHVPYISMFSQKTVEEMKLPKDIAQPQHTIILSALVETVRNVTLKFDYDSAFFTLKPEILADKSGGKALGPSKTAEITITCKKDLDSNKEIKIYAYPQDNKYKKSLAGKIIVLQNDEKSRKSLNIALVNLKTKINDEEKFGKIETEEIDALRKALYQCLIVPNIFQDNIIFDLTMNDKFKIITDNTGNKKYGKYILKDINNTSDWLDGGIFHSSDYTDCQDYVKKEYIIKNKEILKNTFFKNTKSDADENYLSKNIFTVFAFGEDSYSTNRTSLDIVKRHALEGEVKNINENTAMLFNGLDEKRNDASVLAHEILHGLGLYHTHHVNDKPITEPKILCTFDKNKTDNIMSYKDIVNNKDEKKQTLWRWQWKIANPNIPSIEKDP